MTEKFKIPDAETRARNVARMREACRQMDLVNLQMDELIAMIEADLGLQKRARLEKRAKQQDSIDKV